MWTNLSYLIKKRKNDYKDELEEAALPEQWARAITEINPELTSYTAYKDIKKETLYVKVLDSFLLSELEGHKDKIKKRINQNRKKQIAGIKFTLS